MAVMRVVPEVAVEAGAVVWEAVAMAATAVAEEEMAADRAATMAEILSTPGRRDVMVATPTQHARYTRQAGFGCGSWNREK